MSEANKALVQRYQDAYNNNELDVLDDILDPNWKSNGWIEGVPQTIESAKAVYQGFLELMPDVHFQTEDLFAEGDLVAQRYTFTATPKADFCGLPAAGRRIESGGISIYRIAGGRIVEHWAYADELGGLEQLGFELPEAWSALRHRST